MDILILHWLSDHKFVELFFLPAELKGPFFGVNTDLNLAVVNTEGVDTPSEMVTMAFCCSYDSFKLLPQFILFPPFTQVTCGATKSFVQLFSVPSLDSWAHLVCIPSSLPCQRKSTTVQSLSVSLTAEWKSQKKHKRRHVILLF